MKRNKMGIVPIVQSTFREVTMENNQGSFNSNDSEHQKDIEDNKAIAALAYLLFFLPLVAAPNSAYGKFHANQGLILLLLSLAISVVGGIIPFIGWFIIAPIGGLLCLVLFILGVINALNGTEKELPIIGTIKIIK